MSLKSICEIHRCKKLVKNTQKMLHRIPKQNISLEWVKVHQGTTGKKEADKEAKYITYLSSRMKSEKSKNSIKVLLWDNLLIHRQERWADGYNNDCFAHILLISISWKRVWTTSVNMQVVINHGAFPAGYNYRCRMDVERNIHILYWEILIYSLR